MRESVKWGLILGGAVAVLNLVVGVAGLQRVYSMALVYLVIAIGLAVGCVVSCLRATAAERGWAGQVGMGLEVGVVASVLVFLSGWLVTAVVVPDYFLEMAEGYRETFERMEMEPELIDHTVTALAGTSPVRSAIEGVAGTMAVSVVTAAIGGIWLRRRS